MKTIELTMGEARTLVNFIERNAAPGEGPITNKLRAFLRSNSIRATEIRYQIEGLQAELKEIEGC